MTIRVRCSTNRLAADYALFASTVLASVEATVSGRHNGGKVVILTLASASLAEVQAALDADAAVVEYEVRS